MQERESTTTGLNTNQEILMIDPSQRGLISKYLKSKHESRRQGAIADTLKKAIVERADGLLEVYSDFIRDVFSDTEGSTHLHPSTHKHPAKSKKHTESYEKVLATEDESEKRRLRYTKTTTGKQTDTESVRIDNPDVSDGTFIYLNLTSGMFEMRDASSMQNLIHGEPHIIPLTDDKDHGNFSDILDKFTDEIVLIQKLKLGSK